MKQCEIDFEKKKVDLKKEMDQALFDLQTKWEEDKIRIRSEYNQKLLDEFCDLFASYICTKLPFWAGKVFVRFVPAQPKSLRGVDGWNYQAV